ncbi:MAG: hypothetical protein MI743_05510 [Sneathiellales bacterium]|nr:hypothetical protein [Sneathiellales bacterium]
MYSRFDMIDHFVQILIGSSAVFSFLFGLYMVIDPYGWYNFVETVKATGPANAHFITDIGFAYLFSGLVLGYATLHPGLRWGTAVIGNAWLAAHGIFHIYEVVAGLCSEDIFWREAPGVLGPPALVFIGLAIQLARQRISPVPLPKQAFVSVMRATKEAYIDDLSNAKGFLVEKFQHGMLIVGHRHHATASLLHMTCLGAIRFEDCGPCVETVRKYAIADGLSPDRIQNALTGKAVSAEDALAYDFGFAIASGDIAGAAGLGDEIEKKFGREVRTELSLNAASVRIFPAMKRGLGHASVCQIPRAEPIENP